MLDGTLLTKHLAHFPNSLLEANLAVERGSYDQSRRYIILVASILSFFLFDGVSNCLI